MITPEELDALLNVMQRHGCMFLEHDGFRVQLSPQATPQAELPVETSHSGIRKLDIAAMKAEVF